MSRVTLKTSQQVAWLVFGVGVVAFVVLAAVFVPWHPYPGGSLDVPSATGIFDQEHLEKATDYASGSRWLSRSALVVSLIVACLLGFTRAGRWITDRLRGPWPLRVLQAVVAVLLIGRLVVLPFGILLEQRARDAGLSTRSWGPWLRDQALGLAVSTVVATVAIIVLMLCTRRWQRAWPAVAGLILAALVVVGSFVYPVLVQPLFNDFSTLPDGELRTEVLAVADREGVQIDDVLVADASKRTTTLNAYVSGFGSTRRVVLYDTLVDNQPHDQVVSIVAHELTHAKYNDVLVGTALGAAGSLIGVGLLGILLGRRHHGLREAAAVPLLLAAYAIGGVVATPVQNTISRQIELRADVGSLEATHDRDAFIDVQRELAMKSLADPEPAAWSQFWFGSHPTALQRIALAHRILSD